VLINGGTQSGGTIEADDNTVTLSGHDLMDGQAVDFTVLTGGTGLSTGTVYYVRDATATTFKVALTPGGAAVDVTVDYSAATVRTLTVDVEIQGTIIRGNAGWGVLGTNTAKIRVNAQVEANTLGNYSIAANRTTNFVAPGKSDTTVDVASTAALVMPIDLDFVNVTGTADITSIQTSWPGRLVTLKFASTAATNGVVDGSTLKIAGNLAYTADDTISLRCNGTNWYETARSVN
jgi:hypothetical protein